MRRRSLRWALVGTAAGATLGGWFVVVDALTAAPVESYYGVAVAALAGALGGAVLGVAQSRHRRDRHEADRLAAAVEAANEGIAILEGDEFAYVNPAHAHLYGYDDPSAMTGQTWEQLYDPQERERLEQWVLPQLDPGSSWQGRATGQRRDGTVFEQDLSLSRLDDGDLVCVVRDITERSQRDEQVAVLNRVLRHNLRTEATVISRTPDLLAARTSETGPDATGENDMDHACRNDTDAKRRNDTDVDGAVVRLRETGDALTDLGDSAGALADVLDRGRKTESQEAVDVVESAVAWAASHHGAVATVDAPERAPVIASPQLEFAVRELLENAIEHGCDGRDGTVEVRVRRSGEWVRVTVADDGPGIPQEERQVLRRGDETPLLHGSGLGLWLVRWIVTSTGGHVRVRTENPGTAVSVLLPAAGH